MIREPYEGDEKRCFTLYSPTNKDCSDCVFLDRCKAVQAINAKRPTFREWARQQKKAFDKDQLSSESISDAAELVQHAAGYFRKKGGQAWNWTTQQKWLDAFDVIVEYCVENGWRPQDYVHAQIDALHKFCIERRIPLQPNMFTSLKAHERFERWRSMNRAAFRRDTRLSKERMKIERLQGAECDFAVLFFSSDLSLKEAYRDVRARSDHWSFKMTEKYPFIRAEALVAGLASVAADLPDRLLVPKGDPPKYGSVRKIAHTLYPQQTVDITNYDGVDGIAL